MVQSTQIISPFLELLSDYLMPHALWVHPAQVSRYLLAAGSDPNHKLNLYRPLRLLVFNVMSVSL